MLIEHIWAATLRETVREAGGRLLGQGFLTPEVVMIVGAEIQARADAQAAIELAEAARGSALVEALATLATREPGSPEERARAAAQVVGLLVDQGFVHATEAGDAVDALSTAGLLERALVEAALARERGRPGGRRRLGRRRRERDRRVRLVDDAERLELGDEDHVARGDGEEVLVLGLARAVRPRHIGVDQRDEVGVVGVEEVGRPRPVSLVRELERPFDDVALGLDPDALTADSHLRIIGARSHRAVVCRRVFDADAILRPWFDRLAEDVPGLSLFDAHTHVGQNDPDGFKQTPEELLEALAVVDSKALVFPMHEPDGYSGPQ